MIWQPLPILSKVLILIPFTIMIPFLLSLTFSILLTLVFVIPGLFLFSRWGEMMFGGDLLDIGDMKVPTFFSNENNEGLGQGVFFLFPVVGVIFGGIHCAGWNFNFPSNNEATLWRVSSALISSIPFLLFFIVYVISHILDKLNTDTLENPYVLFVFVILLQAYVVSRLLLLVEALISLRHLTPGMLALVTWTSFIPHI